jgi:glutaryl-CoA dehydrogenase (non-decarboxylating)
MKTAAAMEDAELWARTGAWLDEHVRPTAAQTDASGLLATDLVRRLGDAGFFGSMLPPQQGGSGRSHRQYAAMSEELGRACSNVRNLVAVQDMVIHAVAEWGTAEQASTWLPRLIGGACCAAFALTEPEVGSDAANVRTTAEFAPDSIVLSGTKTWISFGQIAGVLLVFAQLDGQHTAFLVDHEAGGLSIEPAETTLGLSGSMLGRIHLDRVTVPREAIIGFPASGMTFVGARSLSIGRLSTAAGCVGLAQACLKASVDRARSRHQYGGPIADQQLVQGMLADMAVGTRAARLMYQAAASALDAREVDADHQVLMAKYYASLVASKVSHDAVQLHGAQGLAAASEVGRLFRDAKAMEIIEGTSQVIQGLLGSWAGLAAHPARRGVPAPTTVTARS